MLEYRFSRTKFDIENAAVEGKSSLLMNTVAAGDGNHVLSVDGSDATYQWDSNDKMSYDRANNELKIFVAAEPVVVVTENIGAVGNSDGSQRSADSTLLVASGDKGKSGIDFLNLSTDSGTSDATRIGYIENSTQPDLKIIAGNDLTSVGHDVLAIEFWVHPRTDVDDYGLRGGLWIDEDLFTMNFGTAGFATNLDLWSHGTMSFYCQAGRTGQPGIWNWTNGNQIAFKFLNNTVESSIALQQGQASSPFHSFISFDAAGAAGNPGGVGSGSEAYIWAKADSGTTEMFVADSAGNVTQISPHDEKGQWVFNSKNVKTGVRRRVNMERLIELVEQLTDEQLMEVTQEESEATEA